MMQPSIFLGSEDWCDGYYWTRKGGRKCRDVPGVAKKNMNIHNNNVICIKRNPDLNYHILLENFRKESCNEGTKCGSLTDAQK